MLPSRPLPLLLPSPSPSPPSPAFSAPPLLLRPPLPPAPAVSAGTLSVLPPGVLRQEPRRASQSPALPARSGEAPALARLHRLSLSTGLSQNGHLRLLQAHGLPVNCRAGQRAPYAIHLARGLPAPLPHPGAGLRPFSGVSAGAAFANLDFPELSPRGRHRVQSDSSSTWWAKPQSPLTAPASTSEERPVTTTSGRTRPSLGLGMKGWDRRPLGPSFPPRPRHEPADSAGPLKT